MNCMDARRHLDDHIDGQLAALLERELRSHLRSCASCADHERALRSIVDDAAVLPESIEPAAASRIWESIDRRIDELERPARRPWPILQGLLAASLLIAVSAVASFSFRTQPETEQTDQTHQAAAAGPTAAVRAANTLSTRASEPDTGILGLDQLHDIQHH